MRNTITLIACITLIGMTTTVTSCKNKPEVQNVEVNAPEPSDDAIKQDESTPDTQKAPEPSDDAIKQDESTPDPQKTPEPSDDAIEQDENTPDTQDVTATEAQTSEPSTDNEIKQEVVKVELCVEGNCPCGDGFCAKNSVCIKDKCFCGAFLEKGFIDNHAIESNSYGEFECARYISYEQCTIFRTEYNFICTRSEGCKTGDGRKFPIIDQSVLNHYGDKEGDMYKASSEFYLIYEEAYKNSFSKNVEFNDDLILTDGTYEKVEYNGDKVTLYADDYNDYIGKSKKLIDYEDLIRKRRLNNCGKSLSDNLKCRIFDYHKSEDLNDQNCRKLVNKLYSDRLDRYYYRVEDFEVPSDLECDLRTVCNDSGVATEHIDEYICEIGRKFFKQPCEITERNHAIGLRCIRPEGCVCGNTNCPEHSLCKDGTCTYDIYYENRVCPPDGWDSDKNDIENYKITVKNCKCEDYYKYDLYCYNECWFHGSADNNGICKDNCRYHGKERKEKNMGCYEKCYWDGYDSTMTKTDPCQKSQ